ncbi:PREDICTED: uncharacterized protein LOC109115883 [Nelumbo nucifera]|uniref:Uncharacterized protein LOC109115883 n=1 Tax=Nelumbo nucifera TaxID=4432 RepID=A0A1U8QBP4_NELNU|nr:PREDICTED: uncharacterized protein LOC109115883 [Nelumbo nucifera]
MLLAWLNDYMCNLPPSISRSNVASLETEPTTYHQVARGPRWCQAMAAEIEALEKNDTWTIVDLPPKKHAIGNKWVYRIKYKVDGTIERFKARLIAKGYTQIEGLYYHDTFAPIEKLSTIRCLPAMATTRG